MDGTHIAGAGIGAIVGAVLVALGTRIGLDLTNVDSATLGITCVGAFTGIGHAIGSVGLIGIGNVLLHGRAKPKAVTTSALGTSTLPPVT
jgi:hypothetical protein